MKFLSDLIIYSAIITLAVAADSKSKYGNLQAQNIHFNKEANQIKTAQRNDALGVSNVAEMSIRNGKVSSFSGVYSHPGIDTPMIITNDDKTDIFTSAAKTNNEKSNPSTITKTFDNKYARGIVKISPGSVSVTSIAKSAPAPDFDHYKPLKMFRPLISDPIPQRPFPVFEPRHSPWFWNNYRNTGPSNDDDIATWINPNIYRFFNYWP